MKVFDQKLFFKFFYLALRTPAAQPIDPPWANCMILSQGWFGYSTHDIYGYNNLLSSYAANKMLSQETETNYQNLYKRIILSEVSHCHSSIGKYQIISVRVTLRFISPSQFQEFLQRFDPVVRFVGVAPGYQEQLSSRMHRQKDLNITSKGL